MTDRFLGVFRQSAFSSGFDRSRSRNACRVLRKDRQIPPKSSRRSCRQSGPPRCETLAARRRRGEGARRGPEGGLLRALKTDRSLGCDERSFDPEAFIQAS
jgi:hypothetical protein